MKMFYSKSKFVITLMIVLSLLLQVASPLVDNYGYAEENGSEQPAVEDGTEQPVVEDVTEQPVVEDVTEQPVVEDGSEQPVVGDATEEPTDDDGTEQPVTKIQSPSLNVAPKDLGNIFTFKSLKVNGIEASENMVVTITDGTTVTLDYTWGVGSDTKSGDYAEIDIPDAFKLGNTFENKDIVLSGGQIIGIYSLINNKIRFVFNDNVEAVAPVENGVLGFGVKFNEEKFKTDVVEEIEFNDKSNKTITVIGEPTSSVSSIAKKGTPDSAKDAKKITWVIDVTNPSNGKIIDATVKDSLPAGLELDLSSVKVHNLTVGLDGKLTPGEIKTVEPTIIGQNFEVELGSIDPYKGYRVEYTTIIKDLTKTTFTNNASLVVGDKELPAVATVSGITRSNLIEKDGKVNGDNIDWTIDVNKAGGSIDEAIVEDLLPTGTTLVPGSIKIFKLTKTLNNWNEFASDKTAVNFPVNLGELEPTDAYRIKFKTSIDYSQVNNGVYLKDNNFINKTILNDGTQEIGDAEKTLKVTRKLILTKVGKAKVDYENKEINWTVTVNEANHKINGAIVKDTLPAGLTINKDDIIVKNSAGVVVTSNFTITVPPNDGSTPTEIKIDLGDIDEKYTIEYTTKITDFKVNTFKNGASLGGTGVGSGGIIPVVPVSPPNNSYNKTNNNNDINYDEKTMGWTITANPTREAISELKITDTFPNKGLILLEDTLVVKVGGISLTKGTDYTLTAIDGNYKNGFMVEFTVSLPINAAISITYRTSYDPEKGIDKNTSTNGKYINKANFIGKTINGNDIKLDKEANYTVKTESWNSGKKLGKLISIGSEGNPVDGWVSGNERKIKWEVYTNYLKQNLGTGVSVTDILSYDGKIDKDSIEVREYNVAAGGDTSFDASRIQLMAAIPEAAYEVIMNEDGKGFTIKFQQTVDKRYVIIFTTSVPDISQKVYSNTATTKTNNGDYPYTGSVGFEEADKNVTKSAIGVIGGKVYTDDEVNWKIKINEGLSTIQKDVTIVDTISKGLVYKNDSLKVYKLKGTERVIVEEGYTLNVTNNENEETVLTIKFDDSISSTYEIEYTTIVTATGGTVNNRVAYSGKNLEVKSIETTKLNASQFSYVGGDPSKGKIIITKIDSNDELITAEAEFEVYYLLNLKEQLVEGKTYKTRDGKVEIGNLKLNRTYYIREVKAPNGFEFDSNVAPIEVVVDKAAGIDDKGAYKYSIVNTNKKINITGRKEWINGPEVKPTIKLQLYRNGGTLGSPVELVNGQTYYKWTDLDLTDSGGVNYVYTVKEVGTPDNYKKVEEGLLVTNTYVSPKTEVIGTKTWINGPQVKPTIKLQLYRNGEALNDPITLKGGTLEHEWIDLDLTDSAGINYVYTVKEVGTPVNYEKVEQGLTVTNTYVSPKTEIKGNKVWIDGPSFRPTIKLQLYRNNEALRDPVELKSGTTEYIWTDLDLNDENGVKYNYTIDEIQTPEDYGKQVSENGLTVTNTYKSSKINVIGRKTWIGGASIKPTIELQLYRDGIALGNMIKLKDGETQYTWSNLDKTDRNGKVYKYSVDELKVPSGYIKTILADGMTIINRYNPPTIPGEPTEPTKPDEDEDYVEIDEDDHPLGTINPNNTPKGPIKTLPKTGEVGVLGLYISGLLFIIMGIFLTRKRRTQ